MEHLSVQYQSSANTQRSLEFFGPTLFGYGLHKWGYAAIGGTHLGCNASTICDQYPSGLMICLFLMMVHPDHRGHFIDYLKNLERRCSAAMH